MTDIHCHILPGVDDGARNEQETEEMLRIAYQEGIRTIIATPHFSEDITEAERMFRKEAFVRTARLARAISPEFRIYPGGEIFYSQGTLNALKQKRNWTMCGSQYVLVEFPIYAEFSYIRQAVQNLQYGGYQPILAHIERYQALLEEKNVAELATMGAYMQVNASSVVGKAGWKTKQYLCRLMKKQYIHFVGTDAHGSVHRRPLMKECCRIIEKKTDGEYCAKLCGENAEKLIGKEYIDA